MNNRKPVPTTPHLHDPQGRRMLLVKSAWRKAGKKTSLKEFVRTVVLKGDMKSAGEIWLHNKRCNPSNPPLGLGRTHRKKGSSGGQQPSKPSKREKD